jgi:hypothetical protein
MIDPALIAAAVAEVEAEQQPRHAQAEQKPWQNLENLDIDYNGLRRDLQERDRMNGEYAALAMRRVYGPR